MTEQLIRYMQDKAFRRALAIPAESPIELLPLAQGEYHKNYVFVHPVTEKKLVLRVNFGSQMHLENQICYEYETLRLLEKSGRTPKVLYVDDTKEKLAQGTLVMEYLEGVPLDYQKDLKEGAHALADVHCAKIAKDNHLISFDKPIYGILEECEQMLKVYRESVYKDEKTLAHIDRLMKMAYQKAEKLTDTSYENVCINTELNNHNFIVNKETGFVSVIDWEKPLWGDMAQDLGHMLAPTTTFWKTDIILEQEQVETFIDDYIHYVDGRIKLGDFKSRVYIFLPVTCLRGITWCAMAQAEYQNPDRALKNEDTSKKLEAYLSKEFLDQIESFLLQE